MDRATPARRAPFNCFGRLGNLADPIDTVVVTAGVDRPEKATLEVQILPSRHFLIPSISGELTLVGIPLLFWLIERKVVDDRLGAR